MAMAKDLELLLELELAMAIVMDLELLLERASSRVDIALSL
eukprot:CAMPEP_0171049468 /NCGR_PEP_ID=MMETSP0736-20130129/51719_1 /TAXON_ID=186038 /ORGANISM="Fragilariopsis kerguelensis, Strain L26-C5" /LENGTH=40 /DNA_ID= /DNA_START= /DNA_END= /DNA_ORIENTATION=